MNDNHELEAIKNFLAENSQADVEYAEKLCERTQDGKDLSCLKYLENALAKLRNSKPEERSELARRYAVTITEMEKVLAYFKMFCVDEL